MSDIGPRVLRNHLTSQHREFYPLLVSVVLGTIDNDGKPWATLRCNRAGFLHAMDERRLSVEIERDDLDPAEEGMAADHPIAMLGIDLVSRRRNSLNGTIRRPAVRGFEIEVGQSYGNCPQYIQLRQFAFVRDPGQKTKLTPEKRPSLDARARRIVSTSDTFFVASFVDRENGERQVDVSHRGGKPGFVRVSEDGSLTIPDFAGNLFFNTLGNILINGKAGLTFPDFETGDLLQMTGEANVVLESPEIAAFQGAERLWTFRPTSVVFRASALPLRWSFLENGWSPNTLMTGTWPQAKGRLEAAALADKWRPFVVTNAVDETASIRSFHLRPKDGLGVIPHRAGQHLNIRFSVPSGQKSSIRTYTISSAPSDGMYRLSVKREGPVSSVLHEDVKIGDTIEAQGPYGEFRPRSGGTAPSNFLAGGIGITPIIAMIRHAVYEGVRTRRMRPMLLFQAARTKKELAFSEELGKLSLAAGRSFQIVRV